METLDSVNKIIYLGAGLMAMAGGISSFLVTYVTGRINDVKRETKQNEQQEQFAKEMTKVADAVQRLNTKLDNHAANEKAHGNDVFDERLKQQGAIVEGLTKDVLPKLFNRVEELAMVTARLEERTRK